MLPDGFAGDHGGFLVLFGPLGLLVSHLRSRLSDFYLEAGQP